VEISKGTRISQTVTLSLKGLKGNVPAEKLSIGVSTAAPVSMRISIRPAERLPQIGLGCGCEPNALTDGQVARLKGLRLSHLRADVQPLSPAIRERVKRTFEQARMIGVPLEIAVVLGDAAEEELDQLRTVCAKGQGFCCAVDHLSCLRKLNRAEVDKACPSQAIKP
jgi:hypothetical protein